MAPQIGSRIEYLIPTGNIMVLLLYWNLIKAWLHQSTSFAQKTEIRVKDLRQIDNERWNNVKLFSENDYSAQMLEVHSIELFARNCCQMTCQNNLCHRTCYSRFTALPIDGEASAVSYVCYQESKTHLLRSETVTRSSTSSTAMLFSSLSLVYLL